MEEKTYTLNVRHTGTWKYEVTIPEIGVKKTAPTLDSALNITFQDIVKHFTSRSLILVFALSYPLTRAQTIWLNRQKGKLFDTYFILDEQEGKLDVFLEEARDHRNTTTHE